MKLHAALLSFAVALLSQDLYASPKTDSIVAFLGGSDAKFVWTRWSWCNDNYQPKSQATAMAEGWSLVLMDTRAGTERTLTTGLKDPFLVRISRSGKWVTFIEGNSGNASTTSIIDLTAASPTKRTLLTKSSCTYWAAVAWWIDPANGDEYVFCLDNASYPRGRNCGGDAIYKVKVKSDGTADLSTATKLNIIGLQPGEGGYLIETMVSVSADGKKLGAAFPWPDTKILDIPTGRLDVRHYGMFGCQTNLAPDNSYRFFHCEGDHQGLYMFDKDMSNTSWLVNLRKNLAGFTGPTTGAEAGADFLEPRWSNHVQYFTATWPMNFYDVILNNAWMYMEWGEFDNSFWGWSANQVQTQMPMQRVMKFYMGKFSSDFKNQEKSILIASDPRYFQGRGDAWICSGTTYGNQCVPSSAVPAIRVDHRRGLSVVQTGAVVTIAADGGATVRITDARGLLVRQATGSGAIAVDTRDLAVGAYYVTASQHGKRQTRQMTIVR